MSVQAARPAESVAEELERVLARAEFHEQESLLEQFFDWLGTHVGGEGMADELQGVVIAVLVLASAGIVVAVPFLGACLAPIIAFFVIRRAMVKSKLGDPEVKISPNPACSGDAIRILARVVPKKAVKLGTLSAELMGQEKVVSGSGKHARHYTHKIHVMQVPFGFGGREVQGGEPIMLDATLQLPPGAPLTFAAPSNTVEWTVKLQIELLGWPDWEKTYPLTVRPRAALLPATSFG